MSEQPPSYNASQGGLPKTLPFIPEDETILAITVPTDPKQVGKSSIAPFFALAAIPLFWPHLVFLSPAICTTYINAKRAAKVTTMVLTDRAVYMNVGDFDPACCGSCCTTGARTKSVPLEKITDVQIRSTGKGCCNKCFDVESLVIETAGFGVAQTLVGAQDGEEFKKAVLAARRQHSDSQRVVVNASSPVVVQQPTAEKKRFKIALAKDPDTVKLCVTEATWEATLDRVRTTFSIPAGTPIRLSLKDGGFDVEGLDFISANDDVLVQF